MDSRFRGNDREKTRMNFNQKVYSIVKKIPRGKVTTYGQIAFIIQNSKLKTQNYNLKFKSFSNSRTILARAVGNALHRNTDPSVPCHRVVNRGGRLAPNFAFDGWQEQKRRLETEGVRFVGPMHVDLSFVE